MNSRDKRELALFIAKSYLGRWYKWGGDDPSGFDCSGLIIECLKSVGCLPRHGDWTAHRLATSMSWPKIRQEEVRPGDLVFWGHKDTIDRIIHVEMCMNSYISIGASGGGSRTRTTNDAMSDNAFIKIRPINSRNNVWGFINPYGDDV